MKKFLFLILTIVLFSCSSNDNNTDQPLQTIENKVLLLQVDYITNVLEGAKELVFPEATNDFTITSNFQDKYLKIRIMNLYVVNRILRIY